MKVEPAIDHSALMARIADLSSLPVTSLTIVPEGEIDFITGAVASVSEIRS
ncbi:MAG TPA: hypothetical protein VER55_00760 [Ardenticatenaceae bacterium]|nr:hypothetical protein [Ardenticatenaceae bacterium]